MLLDQFGVLHDGTKAYPGAVEAVEYLASRGCALLIISNSSRRSSQALSNIARLGFSPSCFAGVVTSGEVTHAHLHGRPSPFWEQLGHRCLHFTWGARGGISLEGLGLEVTQDPDAAEFILAHGTEALGEQAGESCPDGTSAGRGGGDNSDACGLEGLRERMLRCAERSRRTGQSIPMVVANPDVVTVHGSELRVMPGTLAREYREAGGEVHLMGKPSPVIYQAALGMLGLQPHEVLAVGDSMEHDIAGGHAADVDTLLIAGGIHAAQLLPVGGGGPGGRAAAEGGAESVRQEVLGGLCAQFGTTPTYVLPWFRLGQ